MIEYPDFNPMKMRAIIRISEKEFKSRFPLMADDRIVCLKAGWFKANFEKRIDPRTGLEGEFTVLTPLCQIANRQ